MVVDALYGARDEIDGLDRLLGQAGERRRDAILAAREAGMTMRAIAAEVGLTSGRVAQIIDRSR